MNCKDCEHYLLCANDITNLYEDFKNKSDVEERCLYFKDKSTMLELPCKVGDTVYDITLAGLTKKKADKIEVFSITMLNTAKRLHFCFHCHNSKKATISFELQDIGKTIFLTKEEAEKAFVSFQGAEDEKEAIEYFNRRISK